MKGFKLDQLHSFVKVVETGTFSAAAEQLNVTQPAISHHIRELEKRLGVMLVERVGKRATPTAAGVELLDFARRIDEATEIALERMAVHATGTLGRVRIGTGATACIYILPPILRQLRKRFPELEISVSTGNTDAILKALEDNSLDVGFVTLPAQGRSFAVTPILTDPFLAVSADAGDLPATATPAAMARLPLILYEAGGQTRQIVDRWFARAGVTPKPVMDLGSVEAIKELVGAGLGCAVLPRSAISRLQAPDALATMPLAPKLHREIGLVLRNDKPLHAGLRATVRAIEGIAGQAG